MVVERNGVREEIPDTIPAIHAYLNNGWSEVKDVPCEDKPKKKTTKKKTES